MTAYTNTITALHKLRLQYGPDIAQCGLIQIFVCCGWTWSPRIRAKDSSLYWQHATPKRR